MVAREKSGQPVRIVAHSMGGVLARTMALECPKVWERMMAHPTARLLMLGTPNGGSWAPMQCLSGDDSFGNTLVAFGAPFQDHAARTMMAQFPGFLQLQAGLVKDDPRGLAKSETWADLAKKDLEQVRQHNWWHSDERQLNAYKWGVPKQEVLDAAVELRRRLDEQRDKQLGAWSRKAALVIGHAKFTPDGYELGPEGLVYLNATDAGDGRVTRASAMLPGVPTWRVDCEHGSLPDAEKHYDAYLELLDRAPPPSWTAWPPPAPHAAARRRPPHPPWPTRAAAPRASAAARPPRWTRPCNTRCCWPTPTSRARAAGAALQMSVFNGDLKFVRQPLMLGHYVSTHLTGTERVVDRLIGGTMQQSLGLRPVPRRAGHAPVLRQRLRQQRQPIAAAAAGLGGGRRPGPRGQPAAQRAGLHRAHGHAGAGSAHPRATGAGAARASSWPPRCWAAAVLGISAGQAAQSIAQGVREADDALAD